MPIRSAVDLGVSGIPLTGRQCRVRAILPHTPPMDASRCGASSWLSGKPWWMRTWKRPAYARPTATATARPWRSSGPPLGPLWCSPNCIPSTSTAASCNPDRSAGSHPGRYGLGRCDETTTDPEFVRRTSRRHHRGCDRSPRPELVRDELLGRCRADRIGPPAGAIRPDGALGAAGSRPNAGGPVRLRSTR